jgi:hypothetical protein
VIPEQDPAVWRKDECGAWIQHAHYRRDSGTVENRQHLAWRADVPRTAAVSLPKFTISVPAARTSPSPPTEERRFARTSGVIAAHRSVGSVSGQTA